MKGGCQSCPVTDCLLFVGRFFVVTNGRGNFPVVFSSVSSTNPEGQLRLCVSFGSETRHGEDNDKRSHSSEETSNGLRLGHFQWHVLARLGSSSIWMCISCKCQTHFCLGMGATAWLRITRSRLVLTCSSEDSSGS